ncbi:MAG: hypothetical protein ACK4OM_03195 [Alphaproteobacteria bacterium]
MPKNYKKRFDNNDFIPPRSQSEEDIFNNQELFEFSSGKADDYKTPFFDRSNIPTQSDSKRKSKPSPVNRKKSFDKIAHDILSCSTVIYGSEEDTLFSVKLPNGEDLWNVFIDAIFDEENYKIGSLGLGNNPSINDHTSVNYQFNTIYGRRGYAHIAIATCYNVKHLGEVLDILINLGINLNVAADSDTGKTCIDIAKERGPEFVVLVQELLETENHASLKSSLSDSPNYRKNIYNGEHNTNLRSR